MQGIINSIIIDDEIIFTESLKLLIDNNFPNIRVIGKATNVQDAISLLNMTEPDLLFLDISLPDGTAFDILDGIKERKFEIIFTTATTEFAWRAFEFAAIHYLIKPVTIEKLQTAIERYFTTKNIISFDERINILKENINKSDSNKILLSYSEGMRLYDISDIVRCESDNTYTIVFLSNNTSILATKPLITFTKLLKDSGFVRIHNQHLINLKYLSKYSIGKTPHVVISDGVKIPVSRTYKNDFVQELKKYAKTI